MQLTNVKKVHAVHAILCEVHTCMHQTTLSVARQQYMYHVHTYSMYMCT